MKKRFSDYRLKEHLLGPEGVTEAVQYLALESDKRWACDGLAMVGIQTGGVFLANRINDVRIKQGLPGLPLGVLDITLYRDDVFEGSVQPNVRTTNIPFNLSGRGLLLVDDVLYTGRTVRAALDSLTDFGRPAFIRLLVLVDRLAKEYPICADLAATTVRKADPTQTVRVQFREMGFERDEIVVYEKGNNETPVGH